VFLAAAESNSIAKMQKVIAAFRKGASSPSLKRSPLRQRILP
jgi:hypothetical protein